jgi:hypothetical protein
MQIEPKTKVVQTHLGSQTSLKSCQIVWSLTCQAKGIQQLIIDRFDDLSKMSQPAPQRFGPTDLPLVLMRWSYQLDTLLLSPALLRLLTSKPFVGDIGTMSGQSCTGQSWRRLLAYGKKGLGQQLIMGTGCRKAKAGHHSCSSDSEQEVKSFVPSDPMTPTHVSLSRQPTCPAPLGITGHHCGAIEHFLQAVLSLHQWHQVQSKARDGISIGSHESVQLSSIRQIRKGCSQMMLGRPITGSFAWKLDPLPKESQGDHLAALQASQSSWTTLLRRQARLAKIIDQNVPCSQEGIQIDHRLAPFLRICLYELTLRFGYRSFQLLSISHQAFKVKTEEKCT